MAAWIKLYTETLSDPKMGRMSDHLYRRTIELFMIAGTVNLNGILPDVEDIAWMLHTSAKDIRETVEALSGMGILTVSGQKITVTHFAERQMSNLTEAERKAAYRDKQRTKLEQLSGQCPDDMSGHCPDTCPDKSPAPVPKMSRPEVEVEVEVDKEAEEELKHSAAKAAAREKSAKKKLTPDQPEFWQRAFGPEAERAKAFSEASGIIPISSEFGRWQKDLRDFTEAGINIVQMVLAVKQVRKEGRYPIKAPGTVLTVARNLSAPALPEDELTNMEILEALEREEL